MVVQIQLRRDSASNWASNNPTLAEGEFGLELDTDKFKVGDGSTDWNSLAYWDAGSVISPLTTKGDIYTYDTDNARLPIGSNKQFLIPDDAELTGLKWTNLIITNQVYVDKSGDDTNGDGSINNPFLTINGAINSITTASSTNVFQINIGPGDYAENLQLKDFVILNGSGWATRIIGEITSTGTEYREVKNCRLENTQQYVIDINNVGADHYFSACYFKATWSGNSAQKSIMRCRGGNLYFRNSCYMELQVTDHGATANQKEAFYYAEGTDEVHIESNGTHHYNESKDLNDDHSIIYNSNTNENNTIFVKNSRTKFVLNATSGTHANDILCFYHQQGGGLSIVDGNVIEIETPASTTARLFGGFNRGSNRYSAIKIAFTEFIKSDGVIDTNTFIGYSRRSQFENEFIDCIFRMTSDTIPTYLVQGGGIFRYSIKNQYGTRQQNGSFIDIAHTSGELRINGTKVVGIQQSAISDPSGGSTIDSQARTAIDSILAVLRTHGLINT